LLLGERYVIGEIPGDVAPAGQVWVVEVGAYGRDVIGFERAQLIQDAGKCGGDLYSFSPLIFISHLSHALALLLHDALIQLLV